MFVKFYQETEDIFFIILVKGNILILQMGNYLIWQWNFSTCPPMISIK